MYTFVQVMKRGIAPGGMNPNPTLFPMAGAQRSSRNGAEPGNPESDALPDSFQNMMAAMNLGPVPQPALGASKQPCAAEKGSLSFSGDVVQQPAHGASNQPCAAEKVSLSFSGAVVRGAPLQASQHAGHVSSSRNRSEQGAARLQK